MDAKINWTHRAWLTYEANINYLQSQWTEREVAAFVFMTDRKIGLISKYPLAGNARNKRYPYIRYTLIHRRVLLVYQYKPRKQEIDLLVFWNTYQHPRRLKPL